MPPKNVTAEQEQKFRALINEIGPENAMHLYTSWVNDSVKAGTYGPEFRDSTPNLISALTASARTLEGVR